MTALNLNLATYEDLKAFEGVGQHGATVMIKLKEEKEFLTEEDIKKSLQGTYGINEKLFDDSKVSLDIPPTYIKKVKAKLDTTNGRYVLPFLGSVESFSKAL